MLCNGQQKQQYTELYQEHADLLECLAQQEAELGIYKQELETAINSLNKMSGTTGHTNGSTDHGHGGKSTHERIKEMVIEKYGSYIEFR